MTPKVSVVVPSYNHAPFLAERLDSVLCQTYRNYEVIILDDCSADGSRQIIRHYQARYPRIKVFINDRNSGNPSQQWDYGVSQATGEYIWIAESDDVAAPYFLERMAAVLDSHCTVGLVYCSCRLIDAHGQLLPDNPFNREERHASDYIRRGTDEIEQFLCVNNTINNASGVLFRKSGYVEAGMADKGMRYCGDWFLYLRMLCSFDIGYVAKPMNYLRIHAASSHHCYYRDRRYLQEVMRIYDYVLENMPLSSEATERIYEQISKFFCVSLRNKSIPPKTVLISMRRIVPLFEWRVLRFLARHVREKCLIKYNLNLARLSKKIK